MQNFSRKPLLSDDLIRIEAPPNVSAAQKLYQKDRFRVQPGSIDSYGLGKGALAEAERKKVGHV